MNKFLYRNSRRFSFASCLGLLLLAFQPSLSFAIDITADEYRLLPPYCRAKGVVLAHSNNPGLRESEFYEGPRILGPNHHYCWALAALMRSYRSNMSNKERNAYLHDAIRDIGFVIKYGPPEYQLYPELYTTQGEILLRLNDPIEAKKSFDEAVKRNPKYARPYFLWALYLSQKGRRAEALARANEGLVASPNSKALAKLVADLMPGAAGTPRAVIKKNDDE